jgi:hypothetical protein
MEYYNAVKNKILMTTPFISVTPNVIPIEFKNKFFTEDETSLMKRIEKIKFPRIGAFEVYYNGKVVFSKLSHGNWPNPTRIADEIKELSEIAQRPVIPKAPGAKRTIRKKRKRMWSAKSRGMSAGNRSVSAQDTPGALSPSRSKVKSRPGTAKVKRPSTAKKARDTALPKPP